MPEVKTKPSDASVAEFLGSVENPRRQSDARQVSEMMARITGHAPRMWGESIIGFDTYSYRQSDGTSATWPMIGLSPRKANLTIYIMPGFATLGDKLAKLGPHTIAKSCLYLTNLAKVDLAVLESIIRDSYATMCGRYGTK
jgi:hypothetical protein